MGVNVPFVVSDQERHLHQIVLDSLETRFREIGVPSNRIHWTMREGVYAPAGNNFVEFPDFIVFLGESMKGKRKKSTEAIPIELKTGNSHHDYGKAKRQLYQGAQFAIVEQGVEVVYGIVVTTTNGKELQYQKIPYSQLSLEFG